MATLTITGRSDVGSVASDIDGVAGAVRGLGDDVARVDDAARQSGGGLEALGEASDNMASRSSQAAGGLGDLAGGLSAIGATGAGTALEGVALAAQTAVGAGDILNLVAETTVGKYVAQTAASIAHRTATIAGSVATGAMTVAQTALNVVMSANPIALVVIAIAALTAGVILAYRNSETFRNIIDGAFSRAKAVVDGAADAVENIVGWFADLPGTVSSAAGTVADKVEAMFKPIDTAIGWVDDLLDDIDGIGLVSTVVRGYFDVMFFPIQTALGWVKDIIDKLSNLPDIDIPFFGRTATGEGGRPALPGVDPTLGAAYAIALTVPPPADKDAEVKRLVDGLREYYARQGQTLAITETPR